MSAYQKQINILLNALESKGLLTELHKQHSFPDEPPLFGYNAHLVSNKVYSDGKEYITGAGGFSFWSKEFALLKSLAEAAERFSLATYRKSSLAFERFSKIAHHAVNPTLFTGDSRMEKKVLGWIKGYNLATKKPTYIPGQAIHFTYKRGKEPYLTEPISTGGAGGFDHEQTLLRGIYEVVERDAFMTMYLAKISVPRIDVYRINHPPIHHIVERATAYNLELMLFDITNDLTIPSFLTILIDRTGLGPMLTLGLKSSLNRETAIVGSMHEAFHTRPWMRRQLLNRKKNSFRIHTNTIETILDRGLLWLSPVMLKHIDFLLGQPAQPMRVTHRRKNQKEGLQEVLKIFSSKYIGVYYAQVTHKFFKKTGFKVYKVTIPALQPLFLREIHREIRMERIRTVSEYFGNKTFTINTLPHPFL